LAVVRPGQILVKDFHSIGYSLVAKTLPQP
jgi:hypothetical protein